MNASSLNPIDSILRSVLAEFAPQTDHELFLARQMAEARSRLAKLRPLAESMLDAIVEDSSGNPKLDVLAKVERLCAAAERSYRNAHKDLIAARKARAKTAQPASGDAATPQAAAQHTPAPDSLDCDDAELELLTRPAHALWIAAAERLAVLREDRKPDKR